MTNQVLHVSVNAETLGKQYRDFILFNRYNNLVYVRVPLSDCWQYWLSYFQSVSKIKIH